MAALLLAVGVLCFLQGFSRSLRRTRYLDQLKLDSTAEMLRQVREVDKQAEKDFDRNQENHARFMAAMLKDFMKEGSYTGPRLFEDGAVAEIRGEQVVWPEGLSPDFPKPDPGELTRAGEEQTGTAAEAGLFYVAGISENVFYVSLIPEASYKAYQANHTWDEKMLAQLEESLQGTVLLVSSAEEGLPLLKEPARFPGIGSAGELGITREKLSEDVLTAKIDGEYYLCTFSPLAGAEEGVIYLSPLRPAITRVLMHTGMIMTVTLVIFATILTYLLSVQGHVLRHRVTEVQAVRYAPRNLRRIVRRSGLTGAIVVFLCTAMFQHLDVLHEESIVGAESLNRLFTGIQEAVASSVAEAEEEETARQVSCGERMAALIGGYPELGTPGKLREYCDILGVDYIMLFGPDGRETACSRDYTGFTMEKDLGEDSEDFTRLLQGIPSVVHKPSFNATTGLTRQMIGVKLPAKTDGNGLHGALVMALVPEDGWMPVEYNTDFGGELTLFSADGRRFFFADRESGEIRYSSDPSLLGRTVAESGIPDKSLQGGYTDFVTIEGDSCYLTTVRQDSEVFYFATDSSWLLKSALPTSLGAMIGYLISLFILTRYVLKDYTEEQYAEWSREAVPAEDGISIQEVMDEFEDMVAVKIAAKTGKKEKPHFSGILSRGSSWLSNFLLNEKKLNLNNMEKTPEETAGMVLQILTFLQIIPVLLYMSMGGRTESSGSLLGYILHGNWMRGLNLFSVCGIITVAAIAFMAVILSKWILSLVSGFSGRAGETICLLLYSLIQYLATMASVYYAFDYLGLSLDSYIASLGVISLALSLGAKDLVSDMLAGLVIVFEGQFKVGDYVVVDGVRAKVAEIGVRSTKMLTNGKDLMFIDNSQIKKVVNKSKFDSRFRLELTVDASEKLEHLEEVMERELPKIAEKSDKILRGPIFLGVSSLSAGDFPPYDPKMTVAIDTWCSEKDYYLVANTVYREVTLICERENLKLR